MDVRNGIRVLLRPLIVVSAAMTLSACLAPVAAGLLALEVADDLLQEDAFTAYVNERPEEDRACLLGKLHEFARYNEGQTVKGVIEAVDARYRSTPGYC